MFTDPALAAPFIGGVALALTEFVKRLLPNLDMTRFLAPLAVVFALAMTFLVLPDAGVRTAILTGLMSGLSASGLWSGTKSAVKG